MAGETAVADKARGTMKNFMMNMGNELLSGNLVW
jgi:hypothetical protein